MSASISTKKKNVGMDFLKQAAGHLSGAAVDYFSDVMPNTTSTLKEAKSTVSTVSAAFINTSQSILPKMRQLKTQVGFKSISSWFMDKEEEYGGFDSDSSLNFDIQTDSADIAEAQISEIGKNANQISSAVVESSHKMVEAQLAATANLMSTAEKQTAVITAGFDKTNETLNKILEVLTKNTATLIETTVASNSGKSANDELLSGGSFNLSSYKKMVSGNFKNSQMGMLASMVPMMLGDPGNVKDMLSPKSLIQAALGFAVDKKAPNFKKNLAALDQAVSDTIMTSLIRLGENDSFGFKGELARMFGIDSKRKAADTSRSSLELKTVPFDSIAHEAITNALPGYLRKILVALGGPDVIYDYRSRSFKTKGAIHKEFRDVAVSKGTIYNASSRVRESVGTDKFSTMVYDMMMADLGGRTSGGKARNEITSFADPAAAEKYVMGLLSKIGMDASEEQKAKRVAQGISQAAKGMGAIDMANQAARNNVNRNLRTQNFVQNANAYNVDLSGIRDIPDNDVGAIAADYIRSKKSGSSSSSVSATKTGALTGLNYTNVALYEIYRKLNDGINVFQVGRSDEQTDKFKSRGDDYLAKPMAYRPKTSQPSPTGSKAASVISGAAGASDEPNLLQNQELEDGSTEELTGGQRFLRWGKKRGTGLAKALFSGSPEQVKEAFGLMVRDISQVASDGIKKGAAHINDSFGNVSGYLKHKMFGTEYSYDVTDKDGNVTTKHIAANKGGIFGWVKDNIMESFTSAKEKSSKWLSSVLGYFDYGDDKDEKGEDGTAKKRKKLLSASVGAFAGAGILGGPIGLLVGAMAGNAISSAGIGKKIKGLLFGHDKETGKPTGLISKAADAIISPIKFQLGKTIAFAGGILKKNVFGPLADIGLALKDRITNHVDSVFKKIGDAVFGPFKKFGKWMLGGIAKIASRGVAGLLNLGSTTLPGKMARGAMGAAGAVVGGLQTGAANSIAGRNSFHTLKRDEEYTIKKGEVYLDPDGKKQRANDDMTVTGAMGIKVQTKAYLDHRRASRKAEVKSDLEGSGYYESGRGFFGRIKGFVGGDYKKWHEADLKRQQGRRNKLGEYTEHREKTAKELADEQAAADAKRTADNTEKIAEDQDELRNIVKGEVIPGSSFKSHDEGIHNRLDDLLELFGGKRRGSTSIGSGIKPNDKEKSGTDSIVDALRQNAADNERDAFSTGALNAASVLAASGDVVTSDESRLAGAVIDEAGKPKSNKQTITAKLKDLFGLQKKKKEEENEEGKKKKSLLQRIFDILGGGDGILGKIGAVAGGVTALLGAFDLKSFWDNVVKGDMNFSEWWGEKSTIGKAFQGIMDVSRFVGKAGGTVVNGISRGIGVLTKMVPFLPPLEPPQIDTNGPMAGLSTAILGGLYLKGASAIGSIASAAASLMSAGSNMASKIPGIGKYAGLATGAFALGGSLYGWSQGGYKHDQTDASGSEIIDQTTQGAFDSTSMKYLGHTMMGTINPISGKSSLTGAFFNPKGGSVFAAAAPPVTSMTSSTGKLINKVDDVWRYADSGRAVSAANLAKATPNVSTVANAADSKGAVGFVTKALTAIKNFLMKNKVFKAFANTIGKKIDDVITSVVRGGQKIFQKFANKVVSIITRGTVKEASGAATLGIGYAVMAFGGALSGGLSAANIFGVRESDVNGTMRTVASVIVAMLNGVPGLWALELVDLVLQPLMGTNIRSILCSLLYNLLGGADDLADKQETFSQDLSAYNEKFQTSLGIEEYNDMANKGMFAKIFGYGATKTDENGRMMTDEAGHELRTGHGIAGWVTGSERAYVKDANGAVLRDENNNAIQAVDQYGNKIKKDMKWGDHVGNFLGGVGRWFTGGDEYEVDENGQAIYDPETGGFKVKETKGNVFQRAGSAISDWWGGKEVTNPDGTVTKTTGFAEAASTTLGNIGKTIAKPFQDAGAAIAGWWGGEYELDENGEPFKDENGKPIRKGGFKDWALSGLGKFAGAAGNVIGGVATSAKEWLLGEYERDGDGNPVVGDDGRPIRKGGLAGWVKGSLGKLNETFVQPAKEMIQGAKEWITDKAEWVGEGLSSAKDWIVGKASDLWTNISTPVKEAAGAAGAWIADKASWIGDKAKDIGGWISDKAGSLWKSISTPVKDAATAASDWVSKKAAWISDKAKDAKDWITDKAGKLFSCITDNVKGLVDGASSWVKEKATWVKDGVKSAADWIGQKAASIWDWITGGIDKMADKGEQAKRDEEYIRSQQSNRGGARLAVGGVGGAFEDVATSVSTAATAAAAVVPGASVAKPGGNPLNKPFSITSPFGYRTNPKPGGHAGIDIVPAQNGDTPTEVGARFPGTVTYVKTDVPASDTARRGSDGKYHYYGSNDAGNMVTIKADDGTIIKNMHLAPGSIPSTIKKGARVNIGDKIGIMGSTGWSTGPHLHYQLEKPAGTPFDPYSSISGGTTISSFASDGSTYAAAYGEGVPDVPLDPSQSVVDNGMAETGLGKLLSALGKLGMAFLSFITGGLITGEGNGSVSDTSANINYDSYGMSTGSSGNIGLIDGPVEKLTTKQVAAIQSKREMKEVIDLTTGKSFFVSWAASPNYHSDWTPWSPEDVQTIWKFLHPNGGGNMSNPKDWSWDARPGVLKLNGHMIACGFHLRPHAAIMGGNPGYPFSSQSNTKPAGGWPLGGHMCMYYGDSPGGTPKCNEAAELAYKLGNEMFKAQAENMAASSAALAEGAANGVLGAGEKLTVPNGYGTFVTYEKEILNGKYNHPTHGWAASSAQGVMRKDAIAKGRIKPTNMYGLNSVAAIDGRALIATPWPKIGNKLPIAVGDHLDVQFDDGSVWNTMVGDTKSPKDAGSTVWGHGNGKNTVELIYWDYKNNPKNVNKKVTSITKTGKSYWNSNAVGSQAQLKAALPGVKEQYTDYAGGGMGGPDESDIGSTNYSPKSASSSQSRIGTFNFRPKNGVSRPTTSSSSVNLPTFSSSDSYDSIDGGVGGVSSGSIGRIESLLVQAVRELIAITSNTGSSSDLLGAINEKGFVDQGLRDSIAAVSRQPKKNYARHTQSNPNNVRTVTALARP